MSQLFRILMGTLIAFAVSACGGSGPTQVVFEEVETDRDRNDAPNDDDAGDDDDGDDPDDGFGTNPPEETETEASNLLETLSAIAAASPATETEVALAGLVIVVDEGTGARQIVRQDGAYVFADDALLLDGDIVTLSEDVSGAFLASSGFTQSDAAGIIGLPTAADEMPVTGEATFVGGAAGFIIQPDNGFDLTNGTSEVTVQFVPGSVTAALRDFTVTSQISGNEVISPADEIILRGAVIDETGFSGGTLELLDDGVLVDLTGDDTILQAQGQFFGLDDDGRLPEEVGGLLLATGNDGIVFGTFIAD